MTATLLTLLCLTVLREPVAVLLGALLPDVSVAPEVNYAADMAQSLLLFALPGLLLTTRGDTPTTEGRKLPVWLLVGVACAVLARAALTPLNNWWAGLLGVQGAMVPVAQGTAAQVLQVLSLAVVPAIAEELFFRGALLRDLRRCCGRWTALLLTTLMFALLHGSVAGLPGHLAISLLLTLLMLHSGSILVPITAHLCYNLLGLVWPQTAAVAAWLCGCALAAAVAAMMLRLPKGGERRLNRVDMLLCAVILAVMAAQYFV